MATEERLALFWLNSLVDVPSALLVNDLSELADGSVLCDVVATLQRKSRSGAAPAIAMTALESAMRWLIDTFGHAALPTELASPGAAERIRRGHVLTTLALCRFLKARFDELDMLAMVASPLRPRPAASLLTTAMMSGSPLAAVVSHMTAAAAAPVPPDRRAATPSRRSAPVLGAAPPPATAAAAGTGNRLISSAAATAAVAGSRPHPSAGTATAALPVRAAAVAVDVDGPPSSGPPPTTAAAGPARVAIEAGIMDITRHGAPSTSHPPRYVAAPLPAPPQPRPAAAMLPASSVVTGSTRSSVVGPPRAAPAAAVRPRHVEAAPAAPVVQPAFMRARQASAAAASGTAAVDSRSLSASRAAATASGDPPPSKSAVAAFTASTLPTSHGIVHAPQLPVTHLPSRLEEMRAQAGTSRTTEMLTALVPTGQRRVSFAEDVSGVASGEGWAEMIDGVEVTTPRPTPAAVGLRVGGLYDPAYRPRIAVPAPLATTSHVPSGSLRRAAAGAHGSRDSSRASSAPPSPDRGPMMPPVATTSAGPASRQLPASMPPRSAPHATAPPAVAEGTLPARGPAPRAGIGEDGLTPKRRSLLSWLHRLGIATKPSQRESYCACDLPDGLGPGAYLPAVAADGVLINQVVVAAETRAGSKLRTMAQRIAVDWDDEARPTAFVTLHLLPGTVLPKTRGALSLAGATKNLELALAVLRERPRVSPRYLWATDAIRDRTDEDAVWGLLEDIHKAYATATGGLTTAAPSGAARDVSEPAHDRHIKEADSAAGGAGGGGVPLAESHTHLHQAQRLRQSAMVPALAPAVPPLALPSSTAAATTRLGASGRGPAASHPAVVLPPGTTSPTKIVASAGRSGVEVAVHALAHAAPAASHPGTTAVATAAKQTLPPPAVAPAARVLKPMPQPVPIPIELLPLLPNAHMYAAAAAAAAMGGISAAGGRATAASLGRGSTRQLQAAQAAAAAASADAIVAPAHDEIAAARAWLRYLGFGSMLSTAGMVGTASGGGMHVLDDPLTNGVLLAALVRRLEPGLPPLGGAGARVAFSRPRSFPEARANLEAALSTLRLAPPVQGAVPVTLSATAHDALTPLPRIPRAALWSAEEVLLGNRDAMLCLLVSTMRLYQWVEAHAAYHPFAQRAAPSAGGSRGGSTAASPQTTPPGDLHPADAHLLVAPRVDLDDGAGWHSPAGGRLPADSASHDGGGPHMSAAPLSLDNAATYASATAAATTTAVSTALTTAATGGAGRLPLATQPSGSRGLLAIMTAPTGGAVPSPPVATGWADFGGQDGEGGDGLAAAAAPSADPLAAQEAAVAAWLHDLMGGGNGGLGDGSDAQPPTTLEELLPMLTSGELLAGLAAELSGRPIHGVTLPARTAATARANIEKALATLRGTPGMSKRTLSLPDLAVRLHSGALSVLVPLLVDCMRFHRGEPPIASQPTGAATLLLAASPARGHDHAREGVADPSMSMVRLASGSTVALSALPVLPPTPAVVGAPPGVEQAAFALASPRDGGAVGAAAALHGIERGPPAAGSSQVPPIPLGHMVGHAAIAAASPSLDEDRVSADVDAIARWLRGLHIPLDRPEQLLYDQGTAADFVDGVLLARIVQCCENVRGMRRDMLAGIERFPRTGAAKLSNVRRALEHLRSVPSMPLDYLWSELAIRAGHVPTVRGLLLHIRRAFGFRD